MKRIMGVLASVSIVGGLLAGCGGAKKNDAAAVKATPSATTSAASTAVPNEAKKLKLWFLFTQGKIVSIKSTRLRKVLTKLNQASP